jgi:hypothetical protein
MPKTQPKYTELVDEDNIDVILTPKEAADMLAVSVRTLAGWRAQGRGPAYVRYSATLVGYWKRDLLSFIAQQRRVTSEQG